MSGFSAKYFEETRHCERVGSGDETSLPEEGGYSTEVRFKALILLVGLGVIRVGLGLIYGVVRATACMHI